MGSDKPNADTSGETVRERRWRNRIVTFFPMFIATLSLVTSIYNGYLNNRFVDLIQNNVARVEYMKTCKEVIDAYFQIKHRARVISINGERERAGQPLASAAHSDQLDGAAAVARFAALGTYLANLRDEDVRFRYSELSGLVDRTIADARRTPLANHGALFEAADAVFQGLNDDCVRSAKALAFR